MDSTTRWAGCLLGSALADALGLAGEGLSPSRQARLVPNLPRYALIPGWGFGSDDSEHTALVALALLHSAGEPHAFAEQLAANMRRWLCGLPPGLGMATLRAGTRLLLGCSAYNSGVSSAGNGPAMRSAPLGVYYHELAQLQTAVRISSRITHTDARAEAGALAIALATQHAVHHPTPDAQAYYAQLAQCVPHAEELLQRVQAVLASVAAGHSCVDYLRAQGWEQHGVSGYINHSVPIALHAWLSHPHDYAAALRAVIACGGDCDTTAAMVGGIVGAAVGLEGLPEPWLARYADWPRSRAWWLGLAQALANGQRSYADRAYVWLLLRNLVLTLVILGHGFRRLLPPY